MIRQLNYIYKSLFGLAIIFLTLSAAEIKAQDATPTPANDTQNVQPENLKGVPQIAPEYQSDERALPELGLIGVDLMQQKPLTLREAIVLALENNKDIEVSRQNVRIAEFDLRAATGFYEPRFVGTSLYERATTPNVSVFSNVRSITQDSIVGNAGVQGSVRRFGTNYEATFSNQRVNSSSPLSVLSPQYNSSFNFNITQPLIRGRVIDQPRRTIEIAKRNLSLTDTQFRQRSIEIITNVQRAYWDLTFTLRNLQVRRDAVRDAKEQLEHNKRLVNEGVLAPVDIIASETQVANFEQEVYTALEEVGRAENNLKNLISQNRNMPIWNESVIPTDSVELDVPRTNLTEALSLALENRPEIDVNNVQKDINAIDQKFFKDQTKPQIDLVAGYSSSGISGTPNPNAIDFFSNTETQLKINQLITAVNPTLPPNQQIDPLLIPPPQMISSDLTGNYFSSVTDIFANRYPIYRVGLQFNLPFRGNQTAKAQFGKSLVEGEQIQTRREQLEQLIQVDVRNALQAVRTSEARLRSAAISRENSEKQYDSEKRKLEEGQSDIYNVLERQTALMNARSTELRAQTELNKAIAELQRATGNSLKANDVEARLKK